MIDDLARAWDSSPRRTFVLAPLATIGYELARDRLPRANALGVSLVAAGFVLYRWAGAYRGRLGGGGPGFAAPPERLVTTGPYAIVRNPMYLGHLVFLAGLLVATRSPVALAALLVQLDRFRDRVERDERRLSRRFGEAYAAYAGRVPRWLPAYRTGAPRRPGPAPPLVLYHRIAQPESARIRGLVVRLGLKRRIDFQNADTDAVAAFAALGGTVTPALWDGERLIVGGAVEAKLRRLRGR